jgi:hypothetical protein
MPHLKQPREQVAGDPGKLGTSSASFPSADPRLDDRGNNTAKGAGK